MDSYKQILEPQHNKLQQYHVHMSEDTIYQIDTVMKLFHSPSCTFDIYQSINAPLYEVLLQVSTC